MAGSRARMLVAALTVAAAPRRAQKQNPRTFAGTALSGGFRVVAGPGFEPGTFGL